jgi:hypothetical protein
MNRREFNLAALATLAGAGHVPNWQPVTFFDGTGADAHGTKNAGIGEPLYPYDKMKWLYIGCENDHPKSWTFMGGGLAPGEGPVIQYSVSIGDTTYHPDELAPDRLRLITWRLRDGYLPCPLSEWNAGPIAVQIQHFAARISDDTATAVFTRVRLTNRSLQSQSLTLNINASPSYESPLSGSPTKSYADSMTYQVTIKPTESIDRDFVAFVSGALAGPALKNTGGYDAAYARMSQQYNHHIDEITHPVALPVPGLADMYKSIQVMIWMSLVKTEDEHEIRAAANNPMGVFSYDRPFSHDTPNYVDQFVREGDYEIAKNILRSKFYRSLNTTAFDYPSYLDTIGKYLLPYAQYLQATGDKAFFTAAIQEDMKTAAHNIHRCRVYDHSTYKGLMKKSQDFENWSDGGDYLLADNWSALHGLQAYKYLCDELGLPVESQWAVSEMTDLNETVNTALAQSCLSRGTQHYLGAFDDATVKRYEESCYSWVPYSGALSTFPWGAHLRGFDLGGFWKERFDASIKYALDTRDSKAIPSGSWGAWWGQVTYGSTYIASAGLQCLYSEEYRTEVLKNIEFLLQNQCAPFQWSEAFEYKGRDQWVGMYTPFVSYGNYESWGANFSKQALLQACVSVMADGTVIIGRGVPNHWLRPGDVIEWANVNVNNQRRIAFSIHADNAQVQLTIRGDVRNGDVLFNLPAFKNNILSVSTGSLDNDRGVVTLGPSENSVNVRLKNSVAAGR